MAERNSEYQRIEADAYWTPQWVYDALLLVECFHAAYDAAPRNPNGYDFLTDWMDYTEIATNPPYNLADQFVRHALDVTKRENGRVAMLLPMQFDCAKRRHDLFQKPPFKAKYTLTRRIRWENLEQRKAGPSQNHAWFVWDWRYEGQPFLGYLPQITESTSQ